MLIWLYTPLPTSSEPNNVLSILKVFTSDQVSRLPGEASGRGPTSAVAICTLMFSEVIAIVALDEECTLAQPPW